MRVSRPGALAILGLALAGPLGAGCGDGEADADAAPGIDAGADAAPGIDAGPCTVSAAGYGDVGVIETASANRTFDMSKERIFWLGTLEPGAATPDVLDVRLFAGFGAFETAAIAPGTYPIAGPEIEFSTCGVCVLIQGDYLAPGKQYLMAQSGTLTITELGASGTGAFRATLTDATFVHVSIDTTTSVSTIIDDGCTTSLDSAEWDTPIEP